jgi:hypothetical protein
MEFNEILTGEADDWIFNSLQIENFSQWSKSRLRHWFYHARENHDKINGDIFEFGVYKGGGAIAMALLLKKMDSNKKIYAFDSFSGFPEYHPNDDLSMFGKRPDLFNEEHIQKAQLCKEIAEWRTQERVNASNISTSGDFSDVSLSWLSSRINKFGLDNIFLIEGAFDKTVPEFFGEYSGSVFSANIDCDLYLGYSTTLPHVYQRSNIGSMIYLDEYYSLKFPGARIAVEEFLLDRREVAIQLPSEQNEFERWAIVKK